MKTQQEINELADAYYDGMAEVMDRFDKKTINDCEGCKKSKPDYTIGMIYIIVFLQAVGYMYASIQNSSKLALVVANIWIAVMCLMRFISKIIKHAKN